MLFALPFDARLFPRLAVVDVVFGFEHVDLGEEGLVAFEVFPLISVVELAFVDEVEVELG